MSNTKRCLYCGKLMQEVALGGEQVLQCPRCKYCEPLPPESTGAAAQTE